MLVFIAYGLLYWAVISLWFPKKPGLQIWQALLVLSIVFGMFGQQILIIGLAPVLALAVALYYDDTKKTNHVFAIGLFIFISAMSIALAANLFPGFGQLKIFDQAQVSKNALPFTMYLNFNYPLIGILILAKGHQLIGHKNAWMALFKQTLPWMAVTISIVIGLAILLKLVTWCPKLPHGFFIWAITNLLFVCVTEEAFFRGFIQRKFSCAMKHAPYGNYLAILVASILFGSAHFMGGIKYMLLATIAGMGYGWAYYKTGRIESSIIAHFGLNVTHFLLFTYPMLATA